MFPSIKSFISVCLAALTLAACAQAATPTSPTPPTPTHSAPNSSLPNPEVSPDPVEGLPPGSPAPQPPSPSAPQPPDWPSSTPEAQGMDSAGLVRLLEFIQDQQLDVHSLLIARHGVLVLEFYNYPYGPETPHAIYSATKSVTSALVGLAIAEGAIPGVKTPMLALFPDRTVANKDERKEAITLEHLLTMSSGLGWRRPATGGPPPVYAFQNSPDPIQFVLDRPVEDEPGTLFFYNSGGSHLLSAIVQNSTGLPSLEYAHRKLFEPLGITHVKWQTDRTGVNDGGTGLWLRPRDWARFGLLYLRQGEWAGQQLLPAAWVETSTRRHLPAPSEEGQGYPPNPDLAGYGYQWWINNFGGYIAIGFGEQQLIIQPEEELVIVITGTFPEVADITPTYLTRNFILPAVKSPDPLSQSEAAQQLSTLVEAALAPPQPRPVPPLPETALQISGKTYQLQSPDGRTVETLTLTFGPEPELAYFEGVIDGQPVEAAVGLDGVPRLTETEAGEVIAQGSWLDDQTFIIEHNILGEAIREKDTFIFEDNSVKASYYNYVYDNVFEMEGEQLK